MVDITVLPSGHHFIVDGRETLLESALRAGLAMNYGCSNGNCGLCKARLVSGEIERVRHHDYVIPVAEKQAGMFLLCANTACSDVVIETDEAAGTADIALQTIKAKIKKAVTINASLVLLYLQLPRTNRLRFLAGQRATLTFKNGEEIDVPIASCPCEERLLEFHLQPPSELRLTANNPVTINGPYGEFVLDECNRRSLLFFADGPGIAPVRSLIEHALSIEWQPPIYLYWFADEQEDQGGSGHYLHNLLRSWVDAFDDFYYEPLSHRNNGESDVLSDVERLLAELPASEWAVYSAGPDFFVKTIDTALDRQNFPAAQRFQEIVT